VELAVTSLHRAWLALKDVQRTGPSNAERQTNVERELKTLREELDQRTGVRSPRW